MLRAATGKLPPRATRSTSQLPPRDHARAPATLARQITAGLTNEYDKAIAIKTWLADNLTYTLELADPGKQEPVDFFLFDRKKGHCEYFASAFAVLARAVGIPTRQVNGFLGGEWNEYQGYVAVRAGDAHSWDEVYFPGAGWVTFDPTPPGDIDALGRGGTGWRARLGRFVDTLRFQWNKWVIEYDLASQLVAVQADRRRAQGAARAGEARRDPREAMPRCATGRSPWRSPRRSRSRLALRRRRRRRRPLDARPARGRPRVRSPIARDLRRGARARSPRPASPREAGGHPARARRAAWPPAATPARRQVGELIELYYAAEWGRRAIPRPRPAPSRSPTRSAPRYRRRTPRVSVTSATAAARARLAAGPRFVDAAIPA